MPLQSTLYSLAEGMGQALARRRLDSGALAALQVGLTILSDPAMHGTASEPDLRGHDPQRRALVVMERHRSALVFDPRSPRRQALQLASQKARLLMPHTAGVFSLAALSNRSADGRSRKATAAQAGSQRPAAGRRGTFLSGRCRRA